MKLQEQDPTDRLADLLSLVHGLDQDDHHMDAAALVVLNGLHLSREELRAACLKEPILLVILSRQIRRDAAAGLPHAAEALEKIDSAARSAWAVIDAEGSITPFDVLLQHCGALRDAADAQARVDVGTTWVDVARVVQALGMNLPAQVRLLGRHPWARLRRGQGAASVPLTSVPMWFATIDPKRTKPELRAAVQAYQALARDALAEALRTHPFVLTVTGGYIAKGKPAEGVALASKGPSGSMRVHPWLVPMLMATTDAGDVTPQSRPPLDAYQRDAAAALAARFLPRRAA